MPSLRAELAALFGTDSSIAQGVWFYLLNYKPSVRTYLGAQHPLMQSVPNMGKVAPQNYLDILHRFLDHWQRVNAAKAGQSMTIGTFTRDDLQEAHDAILAKTRAISVIVETDLPTVRATRELVFGDMAQDKRAENSIVSHLLTYSNLVQVTLPNQPIAQSLPRIFPFQGSDDSPELAFNWQTSGGGITLWLTAPDEVSAETVFLKEGALERSFSYAPSGGTQTIEVENIVVVGELDVVELRDSASHTVADGKRDTELAAP